MFESSGPQAFVTGSGGQSDELKHMLGMAGANLRHIVGERHFCISSSCRNLRNLEVKIFFYDGM